MNRVSNFWKQAIMGCLLLALSGTVTLADLNVVATTSDLAALAQAVGGQHVEITTLAKPTEDPHFVEAKPSFIVKLNRAQVLIEGGAELESGWLSGLLESSRNSRIATGAPGRIVASQAVQMLEVPASLDRSKGDIHALGNPHFLTDPVNAGLVAQQIAATFARLDARNAGNYQANLSGFTNQLQARLVQWQKRLAPFQGARIVSYHNSWPYFARRFGLRIDLFLEPKPGIPPTPAHLANLIALMKAENVRVIFAEPYVSRRTAETVARNTGAKVVDVSYFPGGLKGTEGNYLQLMDVVVNRLADALAASPAR